MVLGRLVFRLLGIAALVVIVISLWRPAWIYGVPDDALAYSLARQAGGDDLPEDRSCVENRGDAWTCAIIGEGSTGNSAYRVTVDGDGCWEAVRAAGSGTLGNLDPAPSACLSIRDYVRLGG